MRCLKGEINFDCDESEKETQKIQIQEETFPVFDCFFVIFHVGDVIVLGFFDWVTREELSRKQHSRTI
jgi:hypothetical protein